MDPGTRDSYTGSRHDIVACVPPSARQILCYLCSRSVRKATPLPSRTRVKENSG